MKVYGDNVFPIISGENFSKMSFLLNPYVFGSAPTSSGTAGLPLTSLEHHIAADEHVYSDAGTTLCTDGQNIQQVNDLIGSNNLTQTTTADQLVWDDNVLNTYPVLTKNSSDEMIMDASITFTPSESYTMYAVAKKTATSDKIAFYGQADTAGDDKACLLNWSDGNAYFFDSKGGFRNIAAGHFTSWGIWIYQMNRTAGTVDVYEDGVLLASTNDAVIDENTVFDIMFNRSAGDATGDTQFAEIALYRAEHDATERSDIHDLLNTKYAIYP